LEFLCCSDEDEDDLFFVLFFELFFEPFPFFREEELVVLFFGRPRFFFKLISLSLFSEAVFTEAPAASAPAAPPLLTVLGFLLILQQVCLHSALLLHR
jgi:hypothetical protein